MINSSQFIASTMADKEAVIYIVDLGSSMADCHNGRTESDLDFSMRWIWDKISTTVAASRKTWNVGVIGVRTDDSDTEFGEEGGYENIAVLQELQPMDLAKMRALHAKIKPSNSETGDCISALVPAIGMIDKVAPQRLKFNRKIFMVTSGEAPLDTDDITDIADRLREHNIQLTILYADLLYITSGIRSTLTIYPGASTLTMQSLDSRKKTRRSKKGQTKAC